MRPWGDDVASKKHDTRPLTTRFYGVSACSMYYGRIWTFSLLVPTPSPFRLDYHLHLVLSWPTLCLKISDHRRWHCFLYTYTCLSCADRIRSAAVVFVESSTSSVQRPLSALLMSIRPCRIDVDSFSLWLNSKVLKFTILNFHTWRVEFG